jgi:hypothetical protein
MKTGPARFCQFTENRPVEFEIFKILRNFEIQNPKKTILYFKNFDQNRIQNFVVFHCRKIEASSVGVKIKKNHFDRFHRNLLFSSQVCFNTFNFILSILISLLL